MRLLIITQKIDQHDPNLGFFHHWVKEFARQCESVVVVCLYEGTHTLPINVRVRSLGKETGVSRIKYLWRFFTFIWQERKNYDAVFVHMNQIYVILGAPLWRMLGKTVSWWYAHGSVTFPMRIAECLTQIVFTSTPNGFRIPSKKVHIVGQGIDTDLLAPSKEKRTHNRFRVVSVGRIEPVKHLDVLIEAFSHVVASYPTAELLLYGAPQTEDEKRYQMGLEALARERGLAGAVRFAGPVAFTDLPDILREADVFVQTSQTGSLDKAVLDALAVDIPAVSTNEAFENFPGVLYVAQSPEAVSNGILSARGRGGAHEFIAHNHSLRNLVAREVALLEQFSSRRI